MKPKTMPDNRTLHRLSFLGLVMMTGGALHAQQSYTQLLFGTVGSSFATVGSYIVSNPAVDLEAADDFTVTGTIGRVRMNGFQPCFICTSLPLASVEIRIYANGAGGPGALQYQASIPSGSPGLVAQPAPTVVDVTLPTPFIATGTHWISMRLAFTGSAWWGVSNGNMNAPVGSTIRVRDNLGSGTWSPYSAIPGQPLNSDLSFALYGPATPTPTIDPCGAWLPWTTPNAPVLETLPRDVSALSASDLWVVGDARFQTSGGLATQTFAMHWDGTNWSITPTPNPSTAAAPNTGTLNAVDGVSPNDVWAGGGVLVSLPGGMGWLGNQALALHWDGASWTSIPTPVPFSSVGSGSAEMSINDLVAIASNDVWFVGERTEVLPQSGGTTIVPGLLMHWNGSGFTLFDSQPVAGIGVKRFKAVAASGPNDVWSVGDSFLGGGYAYSPIPLVMHFDGSAWTYRTIPNPTPGNLVTLYDVDVVGPNEVWILGRSFTSLSSGSTFIARWNGVAWSTLPGPPNCESLHVHAPNAVHAAGNGIWFYDGISWVQTEAFPAYGSPGIQAIDALGPCEAVVAGIRAPSGVGQSFAARITPGAFLLNVVQPGDGTVILDAVGLPPGTIEGYTVVSGTTSQPTGTGPNYGIVADGLTWAFLTLFPLPVAGNPIHWTPGAAGLFPSVPYTIPLAVSIGAAGQTWDFVGAAIGANYQLIATTPVRRLRW